MLVWDKLVLRTVLLHNLQLHPQNLAKNLEAAREDGIICLLDSTLGVISSHKSLGFWSTLLMLW